MADVIVEIDENGKATIEVIGGDGASCEDLTKVFARLGRVTLDRKKPEFFRQSSKTRVSRG